MRASVIVVIALVGQASLSALRADSSSERSARRPPNVVLIISDDQAWTDFGFMGHPVIRTPRLDRLHDESLVFTRGYVTTSLCAPSLATIITGLYPRQHLITGNEPPWPEGLRGAAVYADPGYRAECARMDELFAANPTLPRLLSKRGYKSLQTGKWWHGSHRLGGFTHGMTHGDPDRGGRHGDQGLEIGREGIGAIREFLDEVGESPFFIWYAPFLPHTPHTPPERLLARYRDSAPTLPIARYYAMCEWFDETCGAVLDLLEERGLAEETLVVFITDNGWINQPHASAYAPRSKRSPNDGGLRTPVMLRWPGRIAPRRDDHTLVSNIDLAPTILRACGLEPTEEVHGIDLLDETSLARREAIFGAVYAHNAVDIHSPKKNVEFRWSIRGRYKLIVPDVLAPASSTVELYDVLIDPFERRNLAKLRPQALAELRTSLDGWWNDRSIAGRR